MSDMPEFSKIQKEEETPVLENRLEAVFPGQENNGTPEAELKTLKEFGESFDGSSYLLGEVSTQLFLVDPHAFLPLNSDRLAGAVEMPRLIDEVNALMQIEISKIQLFQKRVVFWEERIDKNKALITNHQARINQNLADIVYDKKNRDYWLSRAESVIQDYVRAEVTHRPEEWQWLIKKYGLKTVNGGEINFSDATVQKLCHKGVEQLAGEYKFNGNKYEIAKSDKETSNIRLIRENGRLKTSNETLQSYIAATYTNDIEPLHGGILLMKEFLVKLKSLSQDEKASFGDLRAWAEPFLDEFIQSNSNVSFRLVTEFRKLASIPLPAENC